MWSRVYHAKQDVLHWLAMYGTLFITEFSSCRSPKKITSGQSAHSFKNKINLSCPARDNNRLEWAKADAKNHASISNLSVNKVCFDELDVGFRCFDPATAQDFKTVSNIVQFEERTEVMGRIEAGLAAVGRTHRFDDLTEMERTTRVKLMSCWLSWMKKVTQA